MGFWRAAVSLVSNLSPWHQAAWHQTAVEQLSMQSAELVLGAQTANLHLVDASGENWNLPAEVHFVGVPGDAVQCSEHHSQPPKTYS